MAAVPERAGDLVQIPSMKKDEEGAEEEAVPLSSLDMRVGKIVSIERHPDADSLYVEQVDVGEGEPRTIISGLVEHVSAEEMEGRTVVALCNLKPRKMRGIKSHGMLLCASTQGKGKVEPIRPPEGAPIGERVWFGDDAEQDAPAGAKKVDKKKLWEAVQPGMRTSDAGVAGHGSLDMMTSAGPVKADSIAGGNIS